MFSDNILTPVSKPLQLRVVGFDIPAHWIQRVISTRRAIVQILNFVRLSLESLLLHEMGVVLRLNRSRKGQMTGHVLLSSNNYRREPEEGEADPTINKGKPARNAADRRREEVIAQRCGRRCSGEP